MSKKRENDSDELDYSPNPLKEPTVRDLRYELLKAETVVAQVKSNSLRRPSSRVEDEKFEVKEAASSTELSAWANMVCTIYMKHLLANAQEGLISVGAEEVIKAMRGLQALRLDIAELAGETSSGAGERYIVKEAEGHDKKLRKFAKVPNSVPKL
jgi:hypothetical protein